MARETAWNLTRLKPVGVLILAVAIAAGGGYAFARTMHMPQIVDIGTTACGLPPASPQFGVPLEAVLRVGGGLPFGVGPVEVPDGGGPISLRFVPALDGQAAEVELVGDTLVLPTTFGPEQRRPRRITIHCRDGAVGSVRYLGDGRTSTTYSVVRRKATALAWAVFAPAVTSARSRHFR
jgi:hypothetical protein